MRLRFFGLTHFPGHGLENSDFFETMRFSERLNFKKRFLLTIWQNFSLKLLINRVLNIR